MNDKIKFSINRFFAVTLISLMTFSAVYSLPTGNGKTKKASTNKKIEYVKPFTSQMMTLL